MNTMPIQLGWDEIVLRLALTVVAGIVLGFDRSERGKAAGMRTTLLVCLAASVAMIQVNLLLPLAGRAPDSFVMNDLMRFPSASSLAWASSAAARSCDATTSWSA